MKMITCAPNRAIADIAKITVENKTLKLRRGHNFFTNLFSSMKKHND